MEQKRYNAPELLAPVGDMERLMLQSWYITLHWNS